MRCVLAHYDKTGRTEQAIYYISKRLLEYEERYSPLEKTCLALVWAAQRLWHYLLSYPVIVIPWMDPLKYLLEKLATIGGQLDGS